MNNQSPLVPQGSLLEQKNKGRAKVKLAVFFVLAVHGVGLIALLMQGCRQDQPAAPTDQATNNLTPPAFTPTNEPVDTNVSAAVVPTNLATPVTPVTPDPALIAGTPTEYSIVSGDTLGAIATKFHVKLPALMAANPGIEPTKLKLGQKIKIPAPAPVTTPTATASVPANGEQIYSVKSGDNLINIAKTFGTTVKAIRAANNLKTDSIKVGQKLTIPAKAAAATPVPVADPATGAPK